MHSVVVSVTLNFMHELRHLLSDIWVSHEVHEVLLKLLLLNTRFREGLVLHFALVLHELSHDQ